MPLPSMPQRPSDSLESRAEATMFLKEHMPLTQIMQATRGRFEEINDLLLEEIVNKHDQGHQLRTAVNAVRAMRQLGFDQREIIQSAAGALIHDVGYNQADAPSKEDLADPYHGGKKAQFKKHALIGAYEVQEKLKRILKVARTGRFKDLKLDELVTYVDTNGDKQMMNEEDIDKIVEAILNHNDYGKDADDYDPRTVSRGSLMVQLFDKLDNCKDRVYKEHMDPDVFIDRHEKFDPKYFHRSVPFCIQNYDFEIDAESGRMKMTYNVSLDEFNALMQEKYPDYKYDAESFREDFQSAYAKSCKIAAEAIGTISEMQTSERVLEVAFKFDTGESIKPFRFSKPERDIYSRATILKVSMAELMRGKLKELAMKAA